MAHDTREQFLDTAEALFSERGFYGVSIAAIADQLGLTKQALLHHFGTKERLYGEVLERISLEFDDLRTDARQISDDPAIQFKSYLLRLHAPFDRGSAPTRLLMRELLDNRQRTDRAGTWYLKTFLEDLIALIKDIPAWRGTSDAEALARIYQLLGAINYFAISAPTLIGIFGQREYDALESAFPNQLEQLIDRAISRAS